MASLSHAQAAAIARRAGRPARARRRRTRAQGAGRARGGILWIVVSGILLAGVVFVNVAVLQAEPLARLGELRRARSCSRRTPRCSRTTPRCSPRRASSSRRWRSSGSSTRIRAPTGTSTSRSSARQAGKPPHPPPARGLRTRLRRHACARRVAAGRAGSAPRRDGVAPAPRVDHDPGRPGHDLRPARRPARDRRADDDRLCRSAPGRESSRDRARGAPPPRRRRRTRSTRSS